MKKKFEGKIIEVGYLIVEAFNASQEFTKIKVEFSGEAFEGGYEVCRWKIDYHHSK